MDDLLEQFLIEGRELVEQASDDLMALERNPTDAARLDNAFRAIHTLKGSVALFDFAPMGVALHAAEDLLGDIRRKNVVAGRDMIDALLECIDASERWINSIANTGRLPANAEREGSRLGEALKATMNSEALRGEALSNEDESNALASKSAGPAVADTPTDGTTRSVRVDTTRIDALVDLVGELIVAKNNLEHLAAQAAIVDPSLSRALAVNLSGFERLTGEMHRAVMHLRMTPLSRTFSRFPRWMRDTAGKLGKTVNFEITDEEAEADKAIVDGLFEPLLHVLRNAVDHGIEDASMRLAAGKPEVGRIALEARPNGDQIVVAVSDDGAGLDPVKLRAVAKVKGLMSDEALNALDDAAVADLIFTPGFSTADGITDISGRGVGMDAVQTAVASLGGRVSIASTFGSGTTVRMTLPKAVLVSTIVTVSVGGERFGVPLEAVAETCRISPDRILPIRSGEAFVLRNRTIPLVRLSDVLQLSEVPRRLNDAKVLIVKSDNQSVGVEIDGVGERLDVLLRPMTGLLSAMPGVLGTALLGDGGILLILDLPELIG